MDPGVGTVRDEVRRRLASLVPLDTKAEQSVLDLNVRIVEGISTNRRREQRFVDVGRLLDERAGWVKFLNGVLR